MYFLLTLVSLKAKLCYHASGEITFSVLSQRIHMYTRLLLNALERI